MLSSRQEEADRCALFREEIAALANDLDVETDRLASALREWRVEEDELSKAEVRHLLLYLSGANEPCVGVCVLHYICAARSV